MLLEDAELRSALQWHFSIFEAFYNIASFEYSTELDTAGVSFDSEGNCIKLAINKEFWSKLTITQKAFIVCHETLHVFYNHGFRKKSLSHNVANIAMDLVINEELVRRHGFIRSVIDPENKYVWHDCFFPTEIFEFKSFEYYYHKLVEEFNKKEQEEDKEAGDNEYDSHSNLNDIPNEVIEDLIEESKSIVSKQSNGDSLIDITEHLNKEEVANMAGNVGGSSVFTVVCEKPKPNKKFYKFITETTAKSLSNKTEESWIDKPRRIKTISTDFFIPNERDKELKRRNKCKAVVFMDTSGSCVSYKNYFWKIASTIPQDKYEIDLYCFDTKVYKTSFETKKLYGFGGTCFAILDKKIREYKKHPDIIFVITDGYGTNLYPEKPEKWIWLMTSNHSTYLIPKESKIEYLKNYDL